MRAAFAAFVAVVLLSGCANSPSPDGDSYTFVPVTEGISDAQLEAVSDGTVTEDEYRNSFDRYSACVADGGFEILVNGEQYDLIDYAIPAEAEESGVNTPCYDSEFGQVDTMWQLAHIDTSYIAELHRKCLINNGIAPKETEEEMSAQLQEAEISEDECAP